ncbi:hypothetical protein CPC08DRAFT_815981 [Agrocybe pediades]|nr:hypothetical protein CPC08DRAFT_815981 [Agrocybe pediades]
MSASLRISHHFTHPLLSQVNFSFDDFGGCAGTLFNQYSHLLPTSLPLSPWLLVSVILFLWLFLFLPTRRLFVRSGSVQTTNPNVHRALSSLFTPTSLAQPTSFRSLLDSSIRQSRTPECVEIDLIKIMDLVCRGAIELRDPADLARLLRGNLKAYNISFRVYISKTWYIKSIIWIGLQNLHFNNLYNPRTRPPLRPTTGLSDDRCFYFDLDNLQYNALDTELRRIQQQLQPGSSAIIEVSCLSPRVRFTSFEYLFCSILYTPYILDHKHGGQKARTAAPLSAKVQDIIAILSVGVSVENIANVSRKRAKDLCMKERDLVNDRDIRQDHINQFRQAGWREDRLLLLWEASLLLCGFLTRWSIELKGR